jgi:hypothetical protein
LATLLGIDAATVKRATQDLCGKHGLFSKLSHGGKSGRASYTPNWAKFREIVVEWDKRMRSGSGPHGEGENGAKLRPAIAQDCAVEGRETAPQTYVSNQSKEPISVPPAATADKKMLPEPSLDQSKEGLSKVECGANFDPGYRAREIAATSSSRAINAWRAAEQRVASAILRLPPELKLAVLTWLEQDTLDQATRAEVHRRGDGWEFIKSGVLRERLAVMGVAHAGLQ